MKLILILLSLTVSIVYANTTNILSDSSDCNNCQVTFPKEKVEDELNNILGNIKKYKVNKNNEIESLKKQLANMVQKFNQYKIKKNNELKTIKKQLLYAEQKISKEIIIETEVIELASTPIVNQLPWIEITVEDNINIYELSLKYYGNKEAYQQIYLANQHVIAHDFQINNGMSLKIPMSETFEEQPMLLNTH